MSSMERLSDKILNMLNRLKDAKDTNCVNNKEFSTLLMLVGDLYSNLVSKNKVTDEDIEQVEALISNLNEHYFSNKHEDLVRASKVFMESIYVADINRDKYTVPSIEYSKARRKVI